MESAVLFKPRVIIIGAGISGLAAAQRLVNQNISSITLLEAKDRVGGRIYTREYGKGHIEIGAQWIHGQGTNPVFQLALKHDLVDDAFHRGKNAATTVYFEEEEDYLFHTQTGKAIPLSVVEKTVDFLDDLFDYANKFSRENIPSTCGDDSFGTFAREAFREYVQSSSDSESDRRVKEAIFKWRLLAEKTENGCQSVDELSLYSWGQYLEYEGSDDVTLKQGYGPVLDVLLKHIPVTAVHLNAEVKLIQWKRESLSLSSDSPGSYEVNPVSESGPVHVTLESGDLLEADYVIFTGSLGVLKSWSESLFEPALPASKMAVIERTGFGTVNKIYLEFSEPFWGKECDGIQLLWLEEEQPFTLNCLDNKHLEEYGEWYRALHGFDVVDQHDNLLCGWIAGKEAEDFEKFSDDLVIDVCYELLERFTCITGIARPHSITRTNWHSDPHVQGSYSYIKAGHTAADCNVLGQPLPSEEIPRLLFAGEATSQTYFSTTHGALLSGEREADRIITNIKQKKAKLIMHTL